MSGLVRIGALVGAAGLSGLIWWAITTGDFGAAGAWLFNHPWGIVTLVDLYLGFALMAVVIAMVERSWIARLFWIAPLFVLGNVWSALWMLLRFGRFIGALRENPKN